MSEQKVNNNKSPDMIKYDDVVSVITSYPKCFKDHDGMATILRHICSLEKFDVHPVSDTITNNNTTVNVIAETTKVREFIDDLRRKC